MRRYPISVGNLGVVVEYRAAGGEHRRGRRLHELQDVRANGSCGGVAGQGELVLAPDAQRGVSLNCATGETWSGIGDAVPSRERLRDNGERVSQRLNRSRVLADEVNRDVGGDAGRVVDHVEAVELV